MEPEGFLDSVYYLVLELFTILAAVVILPLQFISRFIFCTTPGSCTVG